jgi:hypothetical protein
MLSVSPLGQGSLSASYLLFHVLADVLVGSELPSFSTG